MSLASSQVNKIVFKCPFTKIDALRDLGLICTYDACKEQNTRYGSNYFIIEYYKLIKQQATLSKILPSLALNENQEIESDSSIFRIQEKQDTTNIQLRILAKNATKDLIFSSDLVAYQTFVLKKESCANIEVNITNKSAGMLKFFVSTSFTLSSEFADEDIDISIRPVTFDAVENECDSVNKHHEVKPVKTITSSCDEQKPMQSTHICSNKLPSSETKDCPSIGSCEISTSRSSYVLSEPSEIDMHSLSTCEYSVIEGLLKSLIENNKNESKVSISRDKRYIELDREIYKYLNGACRRYCKRLDIFLENDSGYTYLDLAVETLEISGCLGHIYIVVVDGQVTMQTANGNIVLEQRDCIACPVTYFKKNIQLVKSGKIIWTTFLTNKDRHIYYLN